MQQFCLGDAWWNKRGKKRKGHGLGKWKTEGEASRSYIYFNYSSTVHYYFLNLRGIRPIGPIFVDIFMFFFSI